jgi:dUTP pyrophosphatase
MNDNKFDELKNVLNTDFDDIDINSIVGELGIDFNELEKTLDEYQPKIGLYYTNTNETLPQPEYAYITDSGFDLRSTEELVVKAGERALVGTGLSFDIPDGYEIQVRSKSGLALKQGLMVLNSPGTIDFGYISEIKVILFNTSKEDVTISLGQKIAQAVLCPVVCGKWVNLVKTDKIEDKDRNNNGFGSTGLI